MVPVIQFTEQNMVGPCHVEDTQPTNLFNIVIGKLATVASMNVYRVRFVEVREIRHTILLNVT